MALVKIINGLINDIGRKSESDIKGRLLKLREKVEANETRIKDLKPKIAKLESKAKLEKLAPKQGALKKAVGFLVLLAHYRTLSVQAIATLLKISIPRTEHYRDVLLSKKMIGATQRTTGEHAYTLLEK